MKLYSALLLCLASAVAEGQTLGSWTGKSLPGEICSSAGAVTSGGYLYVYGSTGWWPAHASTWRWDPVTDMWARLADMPGMNYNFAAAALNGTCYAFGTYQNGDPIYAFDTATGIWTTHASRLSVPRASASAAVYRGRIFICGGTLAAWGVSRAVDVFNPATGLVTQAAPLPVPLSGGSMVATGGRLYYFGGTESFTNPYIPVTTIGFRYDPGTDAWTAISPIPAPLKTAAAFVLQSRIFVAGGQNAIGGISTTFEYDTIGDAWNPRAAVPGQPVWFGFGCTLGTRGFVFGSISQSVNGFFEYTPPPYGSPPGNPTGLTMNLPGGPDLIEGAWIDGSAIEFNATLSDPDVNDPVRLEVQAMSPSFTATAPGTFGSGKTVLTNLGEGAYLWKCRARDAVGNVNPGGWQYFGTAATDFTVDVTTPAAPVGTSPIGVDVQIPRPVDAVTFTWIAAADASPILSYDVQASLDPLFATPTGSTMVTGPTSGSIVLAANVGLQVYYWRVRAIDPVGNTGPWSSTCSFRLVWNDGVDHASGDGKPTCGFGAGGQASWLALLTAIAGIGRRAFRISRAAGPGSGGRPGSRRFSA